MQVLIYALGGGLGHATRSLALGRALQSRGHSAEILVNSSFARHLLEDSCWLVSRQSGLRLVVLDATTGGRAALAAVQQRLERTGADLLLVDTFPRGIAGELANFVPNLKIPKVYVARILNERYVLEKRLRQFVRCYDRVLAPGESWFDDPAQVMTAPWLVADSQEMLPRDRARYLLGYRSEVSEGQHGRQRPVVVWQGCGRVQEAVVAGQFALQLHRRFGSRIQVCFASLLECFSPAIREIQLRRWPLLCLMNGVELMVAGGGYNAAHECRVSRTPWLALPQPRMYDLQHQRTAGQQAPLRDPARLMEQILQLAEQADGTRSPDYVNGTHAAVDELEELVGMSP